MQPKLEAGSTFGGEYRVLTLLHEGLTSAVYVVEQTATGVRRALKTFSPASVADAEGAKRFVQTAEVCARIPSDHVVRVLAAGVDSTTAMPFAIMELLAGEHLASHVARRGALTRRETSLIVEQIGHALGAAHAAGVVHGGLKSESIFLAASQRAGEAWVVKLLDFGAASVTSTVGADDAPADLAALGSIAYFALTGKRPSPDAPHDPSLPNGFQEWLARCAEREPSRRFADAPSAAAAFSAICAGAPRRKGRGKLLFALAAATVLVAGGSVAAVLALTSGPAAPPSAGRAGSDRAKLCPAMRELIASMRPALHVDAIVTRGLPTLDSFADRFEQMLADFKGASNGAFDYRVLDVKQPEGRDVAADAGMSTTKFQEKLDSGADAIVEGAFGLVVRYEGETANFYAWPYDTKRIEIVLHDAEVRLGIALRNLKDAKEGVRHRIGMLIGHGEGTVADADLAPGMTASIRTVFENAKSTYRFEDVDLLDGLNAVPAGIEGLIVAQPTRDLREEELRRIDEYVLKGNPVLVAASAANLARDGSMRATLSTHGLERLVSAYGVDLRRDVIYDFQHAFSVEASLGDQRGAFRIPYVPLVAEFVDAPDAGPASRFFDIRALAAARLEQPMALPLASSIVLHPEKQPRATVRAFARTSAHARRLLASETDLNPRAWPNDPGEAEEFDLAALVSGQIRSAFGDGSVADGRVLVIASSSPFANPYMRAVSGVPSVPAAAEPSGDAGAEGGTEAGEDAGAGINFTVDQLRSLGGSYAQRHMMDAMRGLKAIADWMTADRSLRQCDPTATDWRVDVRGR